MKKATSNKTEIQKEKIIQNALRSGGFVFPQTVAEVEAFEKNFGTTDVTLPDHLKEPDFIRQKPRPNVKATPIAMQKDNFAVAAQHGAATLPEDIQKKMEEGRKKADAEYNKRNKQKRK